MEIEKPEALAVRRGVWLRADQQLRVGVTAEFVAAANGHPARRVGSPWELDRLVARLEHHGVAALRPDAAELPTVARFFVSDPWGNRVEPVASVFT